MNNNERLKTVDCAIIFMLDEEKEEFLRNNKDFIISEDESSDFIEFIFFDKNLCKRKGVICSGGKKMGNTEACELFYKLSREYKAELYINVGLAGLIGDINIGDVVIVDSLSTMGENNSNTTKRQIKDYIRDDSFAQSIYRQIKQSLNGFSQTSRHTISKFKRALFNEGINYCDVYNRTFNQNYIRNGWCITVPEVIKDKNNYAEFDELRKVSIIEMEAYYIAKWHDLIKKYEPENAVIESKLVIIKSASDFGDKNKRVFEKCDSRRIAMSNLSVAIECLCNKVYNFSRYETDTLVTYFNDEITQKCIDDIVKNNDVDKTIYEEVFENIIYCIDSNQTINTPVNLAERILNEDKQALILRGSSGVGKSTFLSYLYKNISKKKNSILVDFNKLSNTSKSSATQAARLLCRLIENNNECMLFIDGISNNNRIYQIVKNIFENTEEYANLSYCICNAIDDDSIDEICTMISSNKEVHFFDFIGTNVNSPKFDTFIHSLHKLYGQCFEEEKIRKFIRESEINNVDFRLINMLVTYNGDISNKKNLYTFVKDFIECKYGRNHINNYWKSFIDTSNNKAGISFENAANPYVSSVAISHGIINLFSNREQSKDNEKEKFLNKSFILSDDMNLLFDCILRKKRNYNEIVGNIIYSLKNDNISISTETQLVYNVCRCINNESVSYDLLKEYMINKVEFLYNIVNNNLSNQNYYHYLIQYRTTCIALNFCFDEKKYLSVFNNELLNNDKYIRCNLLFHFFYYSKREFDFNDLVNYNIENSNYEMYYNTFYKLKDSVMKYGDDLNKYIISNNQQIIMNIITLLQLIEHMQKYDKTFLDSDDEITDILNYLDKKFEKLIDITCNTKLTDDIYNKILKLISE
jgi:nucleoside phosphorylase